jgi:hypothetical protein
MPESRISAEELRRRMENADLETLQFLRSSMREQKWSHARSAFAGLISIIAGTSSILVSLLPTNAISWSLVIAAGAGVAFLVWALSNRERARVRRTLRLLEWARRDAHLSAEQADRLRRELVRDILREEGRR